jgi:hypothetical protein
MRSLRSITTFGVVPISAGDYIKEPTGSTESTKLSVCALT